MSIWWQSGLVWYCCVEIPLVGTTYETSLSRVCPSADDHPAQIGVHDRSVKVTSEDLQDAKGYLHGWYVELDFQGGGDTFQEWVALERERRDGIERESRFPWCSPPPPAAPRPSCPEWVSPFMFT